ncbi:F-box protein [Iris pallida]|uniref:F-box protein n=1 Tax=Iris pallida TaxID=29817 RepID=A0AAX6ES97_IRIPA|nr:F-box protein [Iris pallida]
MTPKKSKWGDDLTLGPASDEGSPPPPAPDRISALPDTLRIHILALLPYKSAVRACSVSASWRRLLAHRWPHPSRLHLVPTSPSSAASFSRHVDLLLLLLLSRGTHARRHDLLRISAPASSVSHSDLRRWLDYAAATSVSDLSVDLADGPTLFYLKFWAHKRDADAEADADETAVIPAGAEYEDGVENPSLVRLSLSHLSLILPPGPAFKNFPNLESLNLTSIKLVDVDLARMVMSCPILRTLEVRGCPRLRRVLVPGPAERLDSILVVDCPRVTSIVVEAMNVKKFHFLGNHVTEFSLDEVLDLKDVYISCGWQEMGLPRADWMEALVGLRRVRVLTLCSLALQCITVSSAGTHEEFRNFHNLKELQLVMLMMTKTNLLDIVDFFRLCDCPNLEKLFLELPTHMYDPYVENFFDATKEAPLPENFFFNLKIVRINNFNGHQYEMQLVRFLLSKAIYLESLIIVVPPECPARGESSKTASCQLYNLRVQLSQIAEPYSKPQIVVTEHDDYRVRPTHFGIGCKV